VLGSNFLIGLSIGSLIPYIIIIIGLLGLSFTHDTVTLAMMITFNAMANILMKSRAKGNDLYSGNHSTLVLSIMYFIVYISFGKFYKFPSSKDLSYAAFTACINIAFRPPSSSLRSAAAVVPPGEVTNFRNSAGSNSV